MNKEQGFTLMEILVVLAISMIALLLALSYSFPSVQKTQLHDSVTDLTSLMFATQHHAFSGKGDSSYGIRFGTTNYTLFTGASYDTALTHELVNLPPGITFSRVELGGGDDLIFSQGNLQPLTSGEVEVQSGDEFYNIVISSEGLIDSYKLD
jgi:prepilin-type N-terminal cleavage/methylation domain-containing protein